jgi:hypothetical protein
MSSHKLSPSSADVSSRGKVKQVIPLERLGNASPCPHDAGVGANGGNLGTLGTRNSYSYAHAEKNICDETRFYTHIEKEWKNRVPVVPSPPDLAPVVHALEYAHPWFREPENGEWVIGLYRDDDGTAAPLLLWADMREDRFWDAARREHVKPPKFYLRLSEQPQIDGETGYPIIDGAICPF